MAATGMLPDASGLGLRPEAEPIRILVAGASGVLGSLVTRELLRREHRVRTLVHHSPVAPDLAGAVEARKGNALVRSEIEDVCEGVDAVFSSLGASVLPEWTRGRRSFDRVDTPANLNLIATARGSGVSRFVYVGVAGHREFGHLGYVRAHEAVANALASSGLDGVTVRPQGFFATFGEVFKMARKGRVPVIGDGSARTNPIHEADVAGVCADAIEGAAGDRVVGGPDVITRRGIVELAFRSLRRPVRIRTIQPRLALAIAPLARPFNPRMADLTEFYTEVGTRDLVAPKVGTRTLGDYFDDLAR